MNFSEVLSNSKVKLNPNDRNLLVNLKISKTPSFFEFLDSTQSPNKIDPDNIFGSKEFALGLSLAKTLLEGSVAINLISVYQRNLVISVDNEETIKTVERLSIESANHLVTIYPSPSINSDIYLFTRQDLLSAYRHWQMCWFSHLRRCLGEVFCSPSIPKNSREFTPKEVQKEFEKQPAFSWQNVPDWLKYGYHLDIQRGIHVRNFCRNTKGDLY